MDKWISTAERLPEPEKEVLALCRTRGGVDYLCIAIYVAPGTPREDSTIIWDYEACEYDEEQDEYFTRAACCAWGALWNRIRGIVRRKRGD